MSQEKSRGGKNEVTSKSKPTIPDLAGPFLTEFGSTLEEEYFGADGGKTAANFFLSDVDRLSERNALILLYDQTGGPSWRNNTGWNEQSPDHCSWHGVICNDGGRVVGLDFVDNNLEGPVEFVWNLTKIEYIRLWGTNLAGPIDGMFLLEHLQHAKLNGTRLEAGTNCVSGFKLQNLESIVFNSTPGLQLSSQFCDLFDQNLDSIVFYDETHTERPFGLYDAEECLTHLQPCEPSS